MKFAGAASLAAITLLLLPGCTGGWGEASRNDQEAAASLSRANQRAVLLNKKASRKVDAPEARNYLEEIARTSGHEASRYNQALRSWGRQPPNKPKARLKIINQKLAEKEVLEQAINNRLAVLAIANQAQSSGIDNNQLKELIITNQRSARSQLLRLREMVAAFYPDPRSDTTLASYPRGNKGRANQAIIRCLPSHLNNDDPILHANNPGRSHRHQFFGNNKTDANPSLQRLQGGTTSCTDKADLSAYWVPTLLDQGKHPVRPTKLLAYYGGDGGSYDLRPFPRGLRMIAGSPQALGWQNPEIVGWACSRGDLSEPLPPSCKKQTILRLRFPDCWNGRDLDSQDHYSHVAYSEAGRCPRGYPVKMVQLRADIYYPISSIIGPDGNPVYYLSSGPIWTAHGDFLNLWRPGRLNQLLENCVVDGSRCPRNL